MKNTVQLWCEWSGWRFQRCQVCRRQCLLSSGSSSGASLPWSSLWSLFSRWSFIMLSCFRAKSSCIVIWSTWNNNLTLFFCSSSGIVVSFLFHSSLKSTKRFVGVFLYRCVLESSTLFFLLNISSSLGHSWLLLQVRTGVDITEYKQVNTN